MSVPTRRGAGLPVRRGTAVLAVVVGSALVLLLAAMTWVRADVRTVLASSELALSGTDAVPAVVGASLAAAAAALAVAIGGRWAATVGGVAIAGVGALAAGATVAFLTDPEAPALDAAAEMTGVAALDGAATLTPWPYATVAVGVLLALTGVVVVLAAPGWARVGRRFEWDASPAPAPGRAVAAGGPAAGGPAAGGPAAGGLAADGAVAGGTRPEVTERVQAMDDWDALGRGEDPSTPEAR
ncbi:Trp biosynthesis-associated membrane protein [Georgenia faecalis]|uniref:Trp biosynthesis-associated membrane protein n=1 Tax=Georgenia faecalis TaxID=2483799 RepID=UPI000FDA5620|nr:Trp biosynthesis-associated membrane protein [Georgenia faecalis]